MRKCYTPAGAGSHHCRVLKTTSPVCQEGILFIYSDYIIACAQSVLCHNKLIIPVCTAILAPPRGRWGSFWWPALSSQSCAAWNWTGSPETHTHTHIIAITLSLINQLLSCQLVNWIANRTFAQFVCNSLSSTVVWLIVAAFAVPC